VLKPPPPTPTIIVKETVHGVDSRSSSGSSSGSDSSKNKNSRSKDESSLKRHDQSKNIIEFGRHGKSLLSLKDHVFNVNSEEAIIANRMEKNVQEMLEELNKNNDTEEIHDDEKKVPSVDGYKRKMRSSFEESKTIGADQHHSNKDVEEELTQTIVRNPQDVIALLETIQGVLWGCEEEEDSMSEDLDRENEVTPEEIQFQYSTDKIHLIPAVINAKKILYDKQNRYKQEEKENSSRFNKNASIVVLHELCCRYYRRPFLGQKVFNDVVQTDDIFIKETSTMKKSKEEEVSFSSDLKCAAYHPPKVKKKKTSTITSSKTTTSKTTTDHLLHNQNSFVRHMLTTHELSQLWTQFVHDSVVTDKDEFESPDKKVERSFLRKEKKFAQV